MFFETCLVLVTMRLPFAKMAQRMPYYKMLTLGISKLKMLLYNSCYYGFGDLKNISFVLC